MLKYSNKDVVVKVNDNEIYCENITLTYNANLDPSHDIKSKNTAKNIATAPLGGELSLSYFLTGKDPLLDQVNEKKSHTVSMAGLSSSNAYMTKYSLQSTPFGALGVQASFPFYGQLEGTFSPSFSKLPDDIKILNVSDMNIEGGAIVEEDKLRDMSYEYEVGLEPRYEVDREGDETTGAIFRGVVSSGPQRQKVSLSIYDLDISLLEDGKKDKYKINLNDKNGNVEQSFNIDAVILSKSIDANSSSPEKLVTSMEMGQANLSHADGEEPSITSISPTEGLVGSVVTVYGNNFVNVEKVLLGEFQCEISGSYTPTSLDFYVSKDIYSGYSAPIHIITRGAEAISGSFEVLDGLTF